MNFALPRKTAALAIALLVAALLFAAVPASAQQTTSNWDRVDVLLNTVDPTQAPFMLVTGTLPGVTPLPADVSLAVTKGTELLWVGEILGGPVGEDPSSAYRITPGEGGWDTADFTLNVSRMARVEFAAPGKVSRTAEGVSAAVTWRAPGPVPAMRLGIAAPASAQVTTITPGAVAAPGPTGTTYYVLELTNVAAGEDVELRLAYLPAEGATGGAGAASVDTDWIMPLAIVGAVLLLTTLLVISRTKRARERAEAVDEG
ncbi:MAG: hypothetical protein Q8M66_06845 [Actinomycetota bacterium]|nr:hypothetical protein [Actinomycetota bacterium]MDZ4180638.1 hypothetical protein [Coriobacteriia bacterium]